MKTTIISIKALTTALPFANSDSKHRAYLSGVWLHPVNGNPWPYYGATDGHVMCFPAPCGDHLAKYREVAGIQTQTLDADVMVPPETIKLVAKWVDRKKPASQFAVLAVLDDGTCTLASIDGQQRTMFKPDANHIRPDLERVMDNCRKSPNSADSVGFNVAYLAMLKPVASAYSHARTASVLIHPKGPTGPCLFHMANPDGETCQVIIMPMRL